MGSYEMDSAMNWPRDWSGLEERQSTAEALAQLSQFNNMSSRQYDAYVYQLTYKQTGCYQRGALPIPLAANNTCLPGWYCKTTITL